jgi:hypothetical protein
VHTFRRCKGEGHATNLTQQLNTMRKNMVDVVMKTNEYSQFINRVGPGYEELATFIIRDQYVGFLGEVYNFSFTDVQLHIVSIAPTLYRFNVKL